MIKNGVLTAYRRDTTSYRHIHTNIYMIYANTYTYIHICISYWLETGISSDDTGHVHAQLGICMLIYAYTYSPPTYRHIQAVYTPYKHI